MSTDVLSVAVVGAGRMGRTHLRALRRTERAAATAVVDPVTAARESAAAEGLRAHASVEELLAAGGVDAAIVAAPTDLHLDLVSELAAAGVPLLCEKPCGSTVEQTEAAVRAADQAGVSFQVGYWRRFVPALIDVRARLGAGAFGELSAIACAQWDGEPPGAAFRRRSGGILLDMGVHEFDQIRWLTGQELAEVVGFAAAPHADDSVPEDPATVVVACQLSGGAVATVSLGRRFPPGDCAWVELMGTEGYERNDFVWGPAGLEVFERALAAQIDAFAEFVQGGPQRGASGEDAVQAIGAAERAALALMSVVER